MDGIVSPSSAKIEIRQIFYDELTRSNIDPAYIPLDNRDGKPDWFEFWAILNFVRENTLAADTWYGFFSPKFLHKTGMDAARVEKFISTNVDADVILFPYRWDQLSFFVNPWEQGEFWHSGITEATQKFLDHIGFGVDITSLVSTTKSSVFSNFVVAKKDYWESWKALANAFLEYVESNINGIKDVRTRHRRAASHMKVFIQERFPALILSNAGFDVRTADLSRLTPLSPFFVDDPRNRELLVECDRAKEKFLESGPSEALWKNYLDKRSQVRHRIHN